MRGTRRGLGLVALGAAAARAQPSRPYHPRRSADGHHPMPEPGRRAWADANSASGYLVPRFLLRRAGLGLENGQYFSRTGFAGGHEQGIVALLQRQFDAAVTWTSGQGDIAQGHTRGNLRAMVEKGMLNMRDLRIIWTSDPIINGPITVRSELPQSFKDDITNFHLALPKSHPAIYEQIERGGGTGYRTVTHSQYGFLVEMRREEAAERRRRS